MQHSWVCITHMQKPNKTKYSKETKNKNKTPAWTYITHIQDQVKTQHTPFEFVLHKCKITTKQTKKTAVWTLTMHTKDPNKTRSMQCKTKLSGLIQGENKTQHDCLILYYTNATSKQN